MKFFKKLRSSRRALLLTQSLCVLLVSMGALGALLGALHIFNNFYPLRETVALRLLVMAGCGGFIVALGCILHTLRRKFPINQLALRIEEQKPELKQRLLTATGLYQRRQNAHNAIEQELFEQAEQSSSRFSWYKLAAPRHLRIPALAAFALISLILANLGYQSAVAQKALYAWKDPQGGLEIEPGNAEIPRGDNLDLHIGINRWEKEAWILTRNSSGRTERRAVNFTQAELSSKLKAAVQGVFRLHQLQENIQYKVVTPSLESPWYQVSVYTPLRIREAAIEIIPPPYTKLSKKHHFLLRDITVPEGSRVIFKAETAPEIQTQLRLDQKSIPFKGSIEIKAIQSGSFRILLSDAQNHKAQTDLHTIIVKPDEPPAVTLEPGKNKKWHIGGEAFPLKAYMVDDYGIQKATLNIAISGKRLKPIPIHNAQGKTLKEVIAESSIELSKLELKAKDLVSYYVDAWDNREPEAQRTRSKRFYIQIKPPKSDGNKQDEHAGGGPSQGENPLAKALKAMVKELERLIRFSDKIAIASASIQKADLPQLGSELGALNGKIQEILVNFNMKPAVETALRESYDAIEEAIQATRGSKVADSISHQEFALSRLKSLIKEQAGKPAEGESSEENPESPESPKDDSPLELARKLRELREAQGQLNNNYSGIGQGEFTPAKRDRLNQQQQAIKEAVEKLVEKVEKTSKEGAASIQSADSQMGKALDKIQDAQVPLGEGLRAHNDLNKAVQQLEAAIAQKTAQKLKELKDKVDALAQDQRQAGKKSGQGEDGKDKGGKGKGKGSQAQNGKGKSGKGKSGKGESGKGENGQKTYAELQKQQAELAKRLEKLRENLKEQSRQAREMSPELARTLGKLAEGGNAQAASNNMQRAANAIHYKKHQTAAKYQEKTAKNLDAFSADIQNVSNQLSQYLHGADAKNKNALVRLQGTPPPEAYRERVEEYFKNIAKDTRKTDEGS